MEGSKNTAEIRIYVACLAAYNNGILHGRWIDAEQDAWAIYDEVQDMLKASPIAEAEEWAIHDYEGFEGVSIQNGKASKMFRRWLHSLQSMARLVDSFLPTLTAWKTQRRQ